MTQFLTLPERAVDSPFLSLGLCQFPSIPEADGTRCEVRVEWSLLTSLSVAFSL